ncbi:MAG: hypothetical protein H6569_08070 [Lewinellaceae bacterium]|nr:hypothetical protein [Lewinellaceae bacterium]
MTFASVTQGRRHPDPNSNGRVKRPESSVVGIGPDYKSIEIPRISFGCHIISLALVSGLNMIRTLPTVPFPPRTPLFATKGDIAKPFRTDYHAHLLTRLRTFARADGTLPPGDHPGCPMDALKVQMNRKISTHARLFPR